MELLTEKQINHFKSKIMEKDENGCMIFSGKPRKDGYGCIKANEKQILTHRLALWLKEKPIDENLMACHKPIICHNRLCCNPEHLYWGNSLQNIRDKKIDGTQHKIDVKGSKNGMSVLNEEKVKQIKLLLIENKMTQIEIGKKFNVSNTVISRIKNGVLWSHIVA